MFGLFEKKHTFSEITAQIPREDLLRRSRIIIVDDEEPAIIEDLKKAGFSVDYLPDITPENLHKVADPFYDLILLDFGNVGKMIGQEEGLSILRHIKRVNPSIVVITYTSKALGTNHSEFYRMADFTLAKDCGIGEAMESIENALAKAYSLNFAWRAFLSVANVKPGTAQDYAWQDTLIKSTSKKNGLQEAKERILKAVNSEVGSKMAVALLGKTVDILVKIWGG